MFIYCLLRTAYRPSPIAYCLSPIANSFALGGQPFRSAAGDASDEFLRVVSPGFSEISEPQVITRQKYEKK